MKFLLVATLLTLAVIQVTKAQQCTSASDCGPGECCRIGMQRYSTPQCDELRKEGDSCRPRDKPHDANYTYPDGSVIRVKGVYTVICPCDNGLTCERGICLSSPSSQRVKRPVFVN